MGERIKNIRTTIKGLSLGWKVLMFFLALGAAAIVVPKVYALFGGGPSAKIQALQDSVEVLTVHQARMDSLRELEVIVRAAERDSLRTLEKATAALKGRNARQDATIGALRGRVRTLLHAPQPDAPAGTATDSLRFFRASFDRCIALTGALSVLADSLTVSCATKDSTIAKQDTTITKLAADTTRLVSSLARSDSTSKRWEKTATAFAKETKCGSKGSYGLGVCRLPWYVEVALVSGAVCWATHCLSGDGEEGSPGPAGETGPEGPEGPPGPPGPGFCDEFPDQPVCNQGVVGLLPPLGARARPRGVTLLRF